MTAHPISAPCDDEDLVLKYLLGFEKADKKNRPSKDYFRPGSSEELKARQALTRQLRSTEAFSDLDPLSFRKSDRHWPLSSRLMNSVPSALSNLGALDIAVGQPS